MWERAREIHVTSLVSRFLHDVSPSIRAKQKGSPLCVASNLLFAWVRAGAWLSGVTLRATPVGSWGGLGLRRALRATFCGRFVYPVSLRGGSQRPSGFAEPSCQQSGGHTICRPQKLSPYSMWQRSSASPCASDMRLLPCLLST